MDWFDLLTVQGIYFEVKVKVTQSCPTLCNSMVCSTPGFPVHHQLPELTQTHIHRIGDTILSFHPLLPPSLLAFNLSQHQGLFKWVSSSHQVDKLLGVSASASVCPVNIQDWFPLGWTGWISLQSKGLSKSFPTSQFKSINSSALSFLWRRQWHPIPVLLPGKSHGWRRLVGFSPWGR